MSQNEKSFDYLTLDWLNFTYRAPMELIMAGKTDFDVFCEVFPELSSTFDDLVDLDKSAHASPRFYDMALILTENVRINYCIPGGKFDDWHKMGVSVEVPSHGLEWLYSSLNASSVSELLFILRERGCSFSRIDLCYDDFSKKYKPSFYDLAFNAYKDNEYRSTKVCMSTNFRTGKYIFSKSVGSDTFYLGSRDTGKMLRIYDKSHESDGEIDAIRYEFELRQDYAIDAVNFIIEHNGFISFSSYLLSWFKILVKHYDYDNRAKNPVFEEWFNWLRNVKFNE